jgi:hypothetical protein
MQNILNSIATYQSDVIFEIPYLPGVMGTSTGMLMSCRLVHSYHCFRGSCFLHVHGLAVQEAWWDAPLKCW